MSNVAIVYWSGTGNTEAMADLIAQGVRAAEATADLVHATDFAAARVEKYDALAFGCPAMGNEELEDMEFLPMYNEVEPHLTGRKAVLFGSYEWNDGEWMEHSQGVAGRRGRRRCGRLRDRLRLSRR